MTLPLELQIEFLSTFLEGVDITIAKAEARWNEIHALTTLNIHGPNQQNCINNAINFKRAMNFSKAIRHFDMAEAKQLHNAMSTYDNKVMDAQLFEKNKTESMIVRRGNGKTDFYEGADEVARQFGEICIVLPIGTSMGSTHMGAWSRASPEKYA